MSNLAKMVKYASEGNAVNFSSVFEEELKTRIRGRIEEMRSSMFTEATDEDEDDKDDEDDEDKNKDEDDEDLDESQMMEEAMDSVLESAEEMGIELNEKQLVEISKKVLSKYKNTSK